MKYYQITQDGNHIGVATEDQFLRYQEKHKILLFSDVEHAQYIMYGDTIYHDSWMVPESPERKGVYPTAKVEEISENVYNALMENVEAEPPQDSTIQALSRNAEYETIIKDIIQAETQALNSAEGEKIMQALHDAAKQHNPNLTTKEWNQIKKNLLYYLFDKIVKAAI